MEPGRRRLIGERIEEAREIHDGKAAPAKLDVRALRFDVELDTVGLAGQRDPGDDARVSRMGEVGQRRQVDDVELATRNVLRGTAGSVGKRAARHDREIEQLVGRLQRVVVVVLRLSDIAVAIDVIDEVRTRRQPEGGAGQRDGGDASELGRQDPELECRRRPGFVHALDGHHAVLQHGHIEEVSDYDGVRRSVRRVRRRRVRCVKALPHVDCFDPYRLRQHIRHQRRVGAVGISRVQHGDLQRDPAQARHARQGRGIARRRQQLEPFECGRIQTGGIRWPERATADVTNLELAELLFGDRGAG